MKIISKFRDYYDTAQCYGYCGESEVVFNRKEVRENCSIFRYLKDSFSLKERTSFPTWDLLNLPIPKSNNFARIGIIGFCGKLYFPITFESNTFWSVDRMVEWMENIPTVNEYGTFKNQFKASLAAIDLQPSSAKYTRSRVTVREELKDHYSRVTSSLRSNNGLYDLFLEHKTPCFFLEQKGYAGQDAGMLTINCNLAERRFFEQIPPQQAYQEIEMYFGSVLVSELNPPQITSDVILAEKKGFDRKISFRHRKEK